MGTEVYVAGVGMTKFGKTNQTLPELMVEAASKAFRDAQIGSIDYILIGVMNAEEFTGESNVAALVADRLGLSGVPSSRVETASSTGSAVFESGFYAAASGYHRNVLIIAAEKMTHLPTPRTTRILAEVIERKERNYGASMPSLAAMITQRYQYETRLSADRMQGILSKVAIKNHYNGSKVLARFRVENLEIGQRVTLEKEGGLFYITSASPENLIGKMKQWVDQAWTPSKRKEEGP